MAILPGLSIAATASDIIQPIGALNEAILTAWKAADRASFGERFGMLQQAVTRALDLPAILRASVGPRWMQLPIKDQTSLLAVFERYTVASYVAGFARYAGQTIEIDPEIRDAGADRIVGTRIVRPVGHVTRVNYVMHLASDSAERIWQASDVLLEGTISRVSVQRSDFRAFLDEASAARLVARLQQQITDLSGATI